MRAAQHGNGRKAGRREGGGRRAPRVPFALLVTVLVLGGLALLLGLNTASAANELRRHALAVRDDGVAAQVQQLRNEVAASAAPGNLAEAAAALGMVPDGGPAFLVRRADGSYVLRGKPKFATAAPLAQAATHDTKHHKKKPTATHSAKPTKTPSTTKSPAHPTPTKSPKHKHRSTKSPGAHPSHSISRHAHRPTPTPTPTPVVTLPGGDR